MDNSLITLTGKFTYILFRNEGNFYTAAKFEVNDEKAGLKQFKELCETYHLQYKGNCASKIVRVLSTLKAGL